MAGIDVVSKTSSSVTLRLSGLDTSWNGATRTVYWYLADGGYPTEDSYDFIGTTTISGSPSSGGKITFSGLESNKKYYIACMVYHGSNLLAEKYGEVTTDYANSGGGDDGGDTPTEWKLYTYSITNPTTTQSISFDFGKMECYRIRLVFATTGIYEVKFTASQGLIMYMGTTSYFDSTNGMPGSYTSYIANSSGGFNINCKDINTTYYIWAIPRTATYSANNITVTVIPPNSGTIDYFEWSSAVAQGLPVKNVSHTEWDSFIDKIKAVLAAKNRLEQYITEEKYGYAVGTTYNTMLNDCYLRNSYDTTLQGYPLTAKKFNVARFIIGSHVSTGISDKTSKTSQVLASDFITLENCLKTWQG